MDYLTLSWRRLLYWNQSIDLVGRSIDWFLYDNGLRHERVKVDFNFSEFRNADALFCCMFFLQFQDNSSSLSKLFLEVTFWDISENSQNNIRGGVRFWWVLKVYYKQRFLWFWAYNKGLLSALSSIPIPVHRCEFNRLVTLRKMPYFHLISSCRNFVERHSFRIVSGESPETVGELCLSKKFWHQEIRWSYGIYAV